MASTTVTIRLSKSEKALIADYVETFGLTTSEFLRDSALQRIEDELDLRVWAEAKAEFESEPVTLTADEIAKKYR